MSDPAGVWAPPLNIAHRGASARAPENTMAAFQRAIDDGASAVEMDLRTSFDGRVVVIHDRTLDRTTNGSGPVAGLDSRSLQQLDAGSWFAPEYSDQPVPTLEQVVERVLPRIPCVLQAKTAQTAKQIPAIVRDALRPRVTVSSTNLATLRSLSGHGVTRTWVTWWRDWPGWTRCVAHLASRAGVDRVAPKGSTVTSAMVDRVHRKGLMLRAWGVEDDLALAHRLLTMGADGMTFNDPARLRDLIAAGGGDLR